MSNKKPTIFLTVEIKSREFIPKCFLAYHLIKKGFRVYIGSNLTIDLALRKSEPSIIFHKSSWIKNSKYYKSLGHKFLFMDEEGGITTPRSLVKKYCSKRYKYVTKDNTDIIFFPNRRFYKNAKKLKNLRGVKLFISGWPRVDLWNRKYEYLYKSKVNKIKKKYGNFYLFISSFGLTSTETYKQRLNNPNLFFEKDIINETYKYFQRNIKLLKDLSASIKNNETIILRPHPNEKIHEWKRIFSKYNNINVVRDDDITPWLYAANSILQSGSTSTTQAALLGKKSVILKYKKRKGFTDTPSFELCEEVINFKQAYKLLKRNKFKNDKKLSIFTKKFLEKEMEYNDKKQATQKIIEKLYEEKLSAINEFKPGIINKIKSYKEIFTNLFVKLIITFSINKSENYLITDKLKGGIKIDEIFQLLKLFLKKDKQKIKYVCNEKMKNLICLEKIN